MTRIPQKCNVRRSAFSVHLFLLVAAAPFVGLSQAQEEEAVALAGAEAVGAQAAAETEPEAAEAAENPAAGLTDPATPGADLSPIIRDPLWPVGFDPNPPAATTDPTPAPKPRAEVRPPPPVRLPEPGDAEWATAHRQLTPTVGRSVDPDGNERFFTILNNRLVNAGQTVSVTTPVFSFTWRVVRISEAGVEFLAVEARRLSDGKRFPAAAN